MLGKAIWRVLRQFAKAGNIKQTYTIRALRLTVLAPEMVEAVLDGRQPAGMTLQGLMEGVAIDWQHPHESICAFPKHGNPRAASLKPNSVR